MPSPLQPYHSVDIAVISKWHHIFDINMTSLCLYHSPDIIFIFDFRNLWEGVVGFINNLSTTILLFFLNRFAQSNMRSGVNVKIYLKLCLCWDCRPDEVVHIRPLFYKYKCKEAGSAWNHHHAKLKITGLMKLYMHSVFYEMITFNRKKSNAARSKLLAT